MGFCAQCQYRSAACWRRCQRQAHGQFLWKTMRDEAERGKPALQHAPSFADLPEDVRQQYIVGADALWTMEH